MKSGTTYFALALMGLGILAALPLAHLGYAVLAGAAFIAGMLMLWIMAIASLIRRVWPSNGNGS